MLCTTYTVLHTTCCFTIHYILYALCDILSTYYMLLTFYRCVLCTMYYNIYFYYVPYTDTIYYVQYATTHHALFYRQHYRLFWLVTYSSFYQSCSGWTSSSVSFGKRHHAAAQQPVVRYDLFSPPWWKRFFLKEPNMVLQSKTFLYI